MNLMKKIRSFGRKEDGASLAEYAILLVILAVVGIGTISAFGTEIQQRFDAATDDIDYTAPAAPAP